MKQMRFLPLVALATFSLLALKIAGLLLDGRYTLTGTQVTQAQEAAPQKADDKAGDGEKTAATAKSEADDKAKDSAKDKQAAAGADKAGDAKKDPTAPPTDIASLSQKEYRSQGEIALLSSLAARRKQLEKRENQFELRLALLKAAEKRIDERIAVLKELEGKITQYAKQRDDEQGAQYKRLVKMYSGMKPKDAARIFNDLDKKVLLEMMKQMKAQAMSAILAKMDPTRARELTIAMAGDVKEKFTDQSLMDLPKIEGR
jgi:flagellar motility protein MotE (MotC chaperone)